METDANINAPSEEKKSRTYSCIRGMRTLIATSREKEEDVVKRSSGRKDNFDKCSDKCALERRDGRSRNHTINPEQS